MKLLIIFLSLTAFGQEVEVKVQKAKGSAKTKVALEKKLSEKLNEKKVEKKSP